MVAERTLMIQRYKIDNLGSKINLFPIPVKEWMERYV